MGQHQARNRKHTMSIRGGLTLAQQSMKQMRAIYGKNATCTQVIGSATRITRQHSRTQHATRASTPPKDSKRRNARTTHTLVSKAETTQATTARMVRLTDLPGC